MIRCQVVNIKIGVSRAIFFLVACSILSAGSGGISRARAAESPDKLYVVAVSHLDTQWWWTIQESIRQYIPSTFADTFDQLDKYPGYRFSWEGAFRYMLLEEYYPQLFERLKGYVSRGQWAPAGSALEGGDVNVPSPESLVRHFLIGNRYFREKLGKTSTDVFLPDCFGFGYQLPAVATHCGITGFSTQKLYWGPVVDIPFGLGVWKGVNGSSLVAALRPRGYTDPITQDLSYDTGMLDSCAAPMVPDPEHRVGMVYFGVGDQGGPAAEESVAMLQQSMDSDGPVEVVSAFSDQLFRDLTPEQVASLPVYDGELTMTTHGTGCLTSQAFMKRSNRRNEQLADAAERVAVMADWLGTQTYPGAMITETWIRFLSRHFHDDLTGTGIPEIYDFSWNDEFVALNRWSAALTSSIGAVASKLETSSTGIPLVVYNALGTDREDLVQSLVRYPGKAPDGIRVLDPDGNVVPSQVLRRDDNWLEVLFLASVPAVGLAVFDVVEGDEGERSETGLAVGKNFLENERYRVEIDALGDIGRVYDKKDQRELLSAPARLAVWTDNSLVWPAWEIMWQDISQPPREYVAGPADIVVVESGPARVSLLVRRLLGPTVVEQTIRLAAGSAGDRVEVEMSLDWHSQGSLLKAVFPLAVSDTQATYDLGVGTIRRGNNTARQYEVHAQQWADISDPSGNYGVTVFNDSRYGWDKPDDGTLRLTLVHTPVLNIVSARYGQHTMDLGEHLITYGLFGHGGDWRQGSTQQANRVNQPLVAVQTSSHAGNLGRVKGFLEISSASVAVRALKQAEDGDGVVIRLVETEGRQQAEFTVKVGDGIESAEELNGIEDLVGDAAVADGYLKTSMAPYQLRTFRIHLMPAGEASLAPVSRPVALPFDLDVVSGNDSREDGQAGQDRYGERFALPAEQFPAELTDGGVRFELGPTHDGEANAVSCKGQTINFEAQEGDRIYLLASASTARKVEFKVGEERFPVKVETYTGPIGAWVGRTYMGKVIDDPALFRKPYYHPDRIAWYSTHRHKEALDDPYMFTYLYRYSLPVTKGASTLTLPEDSEVYVFAVSLISDPGDRVVAGSRLFDEFDPLAEPVDWGVMASTSTPVEPVDGDSVDVVSQGDVDVDAGVGEGESGAGGGRGCTGAASENSRSVLLLGGALFGVLWALRRRFWTLS